MTVLEREYKTCTLSEGNIAPKGVKIDCWGRKILDIETVCGPPKGQST